MIYGSDEYAKRVAYERDRLEAGRAVTPHTIGGQSIARQIASERHTRNVPPPVPDYPAQRGTTWSAQAGHPAGSSAPGWTGPARARRSSGSLSRTLAFGGGILGAIYAASHGLQSPVGLCVGFLAGFVAVGTVLHYLGKIFS